MRKHVKSTLAACARRVLHRHVPVVVAVTGSVGKSTTKEAIGTVLAGPRTRTSPRNYNTQLGVPLSVLGIEKFSRTNAGWLPIMAQACLRAVVADPAYPDTLVLEMGADYPGNIATLANIAPPKIGVVTGVGESHAKNFGGVDAIAKEKGTLAECLPADGCAILNRDDERVWGMRSRTNARVVTFGFHKDADVRALPETLSYALAPDGPCGTHVTVTVDGATAELFMPHVLGQAAVNSALAGIAVGLVRGMTLDACVDRLSRREPLPGRMRHIHGVAGTTIIDDTYNAAPTSVAHALRVLADIPAKGRKIAILGDMLELGEMSDAGHRDMGALAIELGIKLLATVGPNMRHAQTAARTAGMDDAATPSFDSPEEAGAAVRELLAPGDVVLVKGSRGMHMERAVERLMANPDAAKSTLVQPGD